MLDGHRQISEEAVGSCIQDVSVACRFEPGEVAPVVLVENGQTFEWTRR
jgi:hypothetical protein